MQIKAEGATINYEISGDSSYPALVLWHGAGCTLRMWDTVLKDLKDSFFCIAFDVRGAGESIAGIGPSDQFTFEQYSKDINSILEELEIQKFHLWSMAWGTRAAIAYCSLNPEKVLSAVFSDASVGVEVEDELGEVHGPCVVGLEDEGLELGGLLEVKADQHGAQIDGEVERPLLLELRVEGLNELLMGGRLVMERERPEAVMILEAHDGARGDGAKGDTPRAIGVLREEHGRLFGERGQLFL